MNIKTDPEVEKFILSLEKQSIAKVLHTIDLLEIFGHTLAMPHAKKVGGKLFELRVRGQQEVRIFYSFFQNSIWLLHGFIKKSQKIPQREIRRAEIKLDRLTEHNI